MRIPSGVTDQYIYFVAVDSSDLISRETGLASFTVYRSRNGGAAAAYTTPTINETSSSNMPGVYELLLDEDMTIDAGDDSQEVCLHITHAGMAPVTRIFELYRPKATAGQTIGVSSGAVSNVTTVATSTNLTNAPTSGDLTATMKASINAEVDTALSDYDAPTKAELDSGLAGLNDLDAAGVRSAVGLASANLDTQLSAIDTVVDSILVDTGTTIPAQISALNDLSAAEVNAEVDTALADYDGPTNTEMVAAFTEIKGATWDSGTDTLEDIANNSGLDAAGVRAAVGLASANLDTQLSAIDTVVDSILVDTGTTLDGKIDSILEDTGTTLPASIGAVAAPTANEVANEVASRTLNANITKVNDVTVSGVGTVANPWNPS